MRDPAALSRSAADGRLESVDRLQIMNATDQPSVTGSARTLVRGQHKFQEIHSASFLTTGGGIQLT